MRANRVVDLLVFLYSNNYFKQVSTHFDQPINQIIDESLQFAAKERSEKNLGKL